MGPLPFSCWSATGHSFSFPPQPLTSLPPVLLHHLSSYAHPPCLPVHIIHLSSCPPVLFVLRSFSSFCPHASVLLSSCHSVHLILLIFPSPSFFCLPVLLSSLSSCPPHPPVFLSSCHSVPFTLLSSCSLNPPYPPVLLSYLSSFSTCCAGVP